jgi:hypothetical protein
MASIPSEQPASGPSSQPLAVPQSKTQHFPSASGNAVDHVSNNMTMGSNEPFAPTDLNWIGHQFGGINTSDLSEPQNLGQFGDDADSTEPMEDVDPFDFLYQDDDVLQNPGLYPGDLPLGPGGNDLVLDPKDGYNRG